MPRFLMIRSLIVAMLSTSRMTLKSSMFSFRLVRLEMNRFRVEELEERRIRFSFLIS